MTALLRAPAADDIAGRTRDALPFGLLADLAHPRDAIAHLTPNWFASVMGTGILATAAASLPVQVPGLHAFAVVMWALAGALLVTVLAATAAHWVRYPLTARSHLHHPVAACFYGAPAMALLTVGAGTLLVGRDVVGPSVAVPVDWSLWIVGTAAGLGTAVLVPALHLVRRPDLTGAFGGWLMPVVPPMVSASTGALLVPHTPAGHARSAMLLGCYALFAVALIASLVVIGVLLVRLAVHGTGPARTVPTWWIVLGPLGQSITAANLLGGVAGQALPVREAGALRAFGVDYGLPVLGLALVWAAVALALTVRAARGGLPFSLAWWSFTFPVGTCVTGTNGLALRTGAPDLRWLAVSTFGAVLAAWLVVAARTAHGAARGRLFLPTP